MFQFLKRHIIKAISSLRRGGRRCQFGVVFQVGGESERAFFAFFTRHRKDTINESLPSPISCLVTVTASANGCLSCLSIWPADH